MKLDAESSLPLDALKGAYVYKYIKEKGVEKEVSYRIFKFSIDVLRRFIIFHNSVKVFHE